MMGSMSPRYGSIGLASTRPIQWLAPTTRSAQPTRAIAIANPRRVEERIAIARGHVATSANTSTPRVTVVGMYEGGGAPRQ